MKKKLKVLNLYAGIGGNRKLWDNVEVTAIENNEEIACAYQTFYPDDRVIVADAHEYLLKHYKEYDFIWSSPPCPTHSDIRRCGVKKGQYDALFPDMKLYEEIIFLQTFFEGQWVVENVRSYYDPLIKPYETDRHYFWSNFIITKFMKNDKRIHNDLVGTETVYGFNIKKFNYLKDKRKILRNLVDPKLALHIFNCAYKEKQTTLLENDNNNNKE